MRISNKGLRYDRDVLRHGGADGVGHFLEIGQKCFYKGGQELLNDWIAVAAPALPDADRHAGIGALLSSLQDAITGQRSSAKADDLERFNEGG
jgi:hypothetical protein